jgi:hypothetical protein
VVVAARAPAVAVYDDYSFVFSGCVRDFEISHNLELSRPENNSLRLIGRGRFTAGMDKQKEEREIHDIS